MTTIVGKPGILLCDSRETGLVKRTCTKVWRLAGCIVGGAGASAELGLIEHVCRLPEKPTTAGLWQWVWETHEPEYLNLDETELLVASPRALWLIEGRQVTEVRVGAVGSGSPFALGFLRARPNDLRGAVECACHYDPYSAGPVREHRAKA
jgi:ATP-dependent protease HslVU (ClpYQ) peptidase subunit